MLPAITFAVRFGKFNPQAKIDFTDQGFNAYGNNYSSLSRQSRRFSSQFKLTLQPPDGFDWLRDLHRAKRELPTLYFGAGKTGSPEFYADEQRRSLRSRKFEGKTCKKAVFGQRLMVPGRSPSGKNSTASW